MATELVKASFLITTVYEPTEDSQKIMFLDELWLCLGDFNLIYETRDNNNININR
jgi:hypothetical protein